MRPLVFLQCQGVHGLAFGEDARLPAVLLQAHGVGYFLTVDIFGIILSMKTSWRDFIKSAADFAAIVDSEALKENCSLVRSKDGVLQLVGRRNPSAKNAVVMSEKEAIDLYLKLVSKSRSRDIKKSASAPPARQTANVAQGGTTVPRPYTPSDLSARTSATTVTPTGRGMRIDRGFVDLLKDLEPYIRVNGDGKVNRERLRIGLMDCFSRQNAKAHANAKANMSILNPRATSMAQQTNGRSK